MSVENLISSNTYFIEHRGWHKMPKVGGNKVCVWFYQMQGREESEIKRGRRRDIGIITHSLLLPRNPSYNVAKRNQTIINQPAAVSQPTEAVISQSVITQ